MANELLPIVSSIMTGVGILLLFLGIGMQLTPITPPTQDDKTSLFAIYEFGLGFLVFGVSELLFGLSAGIFIATIAFIPLSVLLFFITI